MCIVKCKGKWKNSGQFNLYFHHKKLKKIVLRCARTLCMPKLFYFIHCFEGINSSFCRALATYYYFSFLE